MGDLNKETMLEVWQKNRDNFRDHFLGNYTRDICKRCAGVSCGKAGETGKCPS